MNWLKSLTPVERYILALCIFGTIYLLGQVVRFAVS